MPLPEQENVDHAPQKQLRERIIVLFIVGNNTSCETSNVNRTGTAFRQRMYY